MPGRTPRAQAWRTRWTTGDWVGFFTLIVGGALLSSAAIGHRSYSWYSTTAFLKQQLFEYGSWALGALAIGIGIVPLVAGLAGLVRRKAERDEPFDTFASLTVAAIAAFVFYTAVKATYLSITFSVVMAERNLIYLVPLLFVGTAIVLERRRVLLLPTAIATGSRSTSSTPRRTRSPSTRTTRRTGSRSRRSRTGSSAGRPNGSRRRSSSSRSPRGSCSSCSSGCVIAG